MIPSYNFRFITYESFIELLTIISTQNPSWNLLTVCYPPTPEDGWGVDEHTDLGFLTILNQDQVGGLEIKAGFPLLACKFKGLY